MGGGEFLYVRQVQKNNLPYAEIVRRPVNGSTVTRMIGGCLDTAPYCGYADPVVSPDGRKLAWEGGGVIHEAGLCSATLPLQRPTRIGTGTSPSYSRDGRYLVFERGGDIWKRDTRLATEVNLTRSSRREWDPRWTKPGSLSDLIVYLVAGSTTIEVYTMTGDGRQRKRVTASPAGKWGPDVAILTTAFLWAENEQVLFKTIADTEPRVLVAGKSPSFGGAKRSVTICP